MKIQVNIDRKGIERNSEATFAPGDPLAITIDGRRVMRDWCDGGEDPGLTVAQDEVLRDLLSEGVVLEIDDDGVVTVAER